jgi:localization factor PodJL
MALMSELHRKGESGIARDPVLARSWLRRAAESGDRVSMHLYALALMNGQDGPRDPEVAVSWFRRAAEAGLVGSQFNLGVVYERGMGVPRDLRQAYVWYSRAADNGDAWELYNLSNDRAESNNLAAKEPERLKAMTARWEELEAEFVAQAGPKPAGNAKKKGKGK